MSYEHQCYSCRVSWIDDRMSSRCPRCGSTADYTTTCYGGGSSGSGGGCFITTACCEYKGMADDCEMLTTFRHFRDTYMTDNYPDEVEQYYSISPGIVESISKRKDSDKILAKTYDELLEAKQLIDSKQLEAAYKKYRQIVLNLNKRLA